MTQPAPTEAQPQAAVAYFIDCAGTHRCVWPIRGAGAFMVVCGAHRAKGLSYCEEHRQAGSSGQAAGKHV